MFPDSGPACGAPHRPPGSQQHADAARRALCVPSALLGARALAVWWPGRPALGHGPPVPLCSALGSRWGSPQHRPLHPLRAPEKLPRAPLGQRSRPVWPWGPGLL